MLRIKLVKSPIANKPKNRATVRALGLRKMHQTVEHEDNPVIRGMIHRVKHLLTVEVTDGKPKATAVAATKAPEKAPEKAPAKATKEATEDKPKRTRAKKTAETGGEGNE